MSWWSIFEQSFKIETFQIEFFLASASTMFLFKSNSMPIIPERYLSIFLRKFSKEKALKHVPKKLISYKSFSR